MRWSCASINYFLGFNVDSTTFLYSITSSIIDTGATSFTTPFFSSGKGDLAIFTVPEDRICFENDKISSSEIMVLFLDPLFPVTVVEACPKYKTRVAPPS